MSVGNTLKFTETFQKLECHFSQMAFFLFSVAKTKYAKIHITSNTYFERKELKRHIFICLPFTFSLSLTFSFPFSLSFLFKFIEDLGFVN